MDHDEITGRVWKSFLVFWKSLNGKLIINISFNANILAHFNHSERARFCQYYFSVFKYPCLIFISAHFSV